MKSLQNSKFFGKQNQNKEEKGFSQVTSKTESGILGTLINEPMSSHKIVFNYLHKTLVQDQGRSMLISIGDYDHVVVLDEGYLNMIIENFGVGTMSRYNGEFYGIMCLEFLLGVKYRFHFIVPKYNKDIIKGNIISKQTQELKIYLSNNIGKIVTENEIKSIIEVVN